MFELLIYEGRTSEADIFLTKLLVYWEKIGQESDQFTLPMAHREKHDHLLRQLMKK